MVDLSRIKDPQMLEALARGCRPILMVYLDWPTGPIRAHTGYTPITWGGHEWTPVGAFGAVEIPSEMMSQASQEASLSLIHHADDTDKYLDDPIRRREVEVYFGVMPIAWPEQGLIGDPIRLFGGLMDLLTLSTERTDEKTIEDIATLSLITGVEIRSESTIYHSDEDQRFKFPGDTAGRLTILGYAKAQKFTWPEN